ncbi:MAG TPA: type II toxin-antitoxin system RelE/ParE family toxin [Streptosporangiaceae bacterium]|jgi:mRNA interferase RelE/StbE
MSSDSYTILFEARARRHLARIDPVVRRRIAKAIDALAADPRPRGCKSLQGLPDLLRIRVGDYRIVYTVVSDAHVVDVIDIDHRKDIYR